MMRILLLASTLVLIAAVGKDSSCDMPAVEPGHFCSFDDLILTKKQLVSDVAHFHCAECEVISRVAGTCDYCEEELTPAKSGKSVCPECLRKPAACEVCVRVFFACEECGETALATGDCPDCETAMEKTESRALVEYRCAECHLSELTPAKCTDEDCERFNRPLERICTEDGEFPHVRATG